MKKSMYIAAVVVISAVVAVCISCSGKGKRKGDGDGADYICVQTGSVSAVIDTTGVVQPRNRVQIRPPVAGRMEQVIAEEGHAAKQGEIIAWMSSSERAILLDTARAKGGDALKKWEEIYKPTPIVAPLDGTIIARNADPGRTVTAQDVVFVLSDRLIVNAQVDETDVGSVYLGQVATISPDAYPDVKVKGIVKQIAYEAVTVNNVTIYNVEVEPESVPGCMKSGMTTTVKFNVAGVDGVLVLPADAIRTVDGKSVALVKSGVSGAAPEYRRVLTGIAGNGNVEILAGLKSGETVIREKFKMPEAKESGKSPFMPARRR